MGFYASLLLIVSAIGFTQSQSQPTEFEYDCSGLPENFLYWWACGSYGICRSGHYAQIDCVNGTTYDRRAGDCVPSSQAVTFPCNSVPEDCVVYNGPGHRYPDQDPDPVENLPPCTFYYTCSYGRYLGHQRCSEGTVYDEPQQRCLPASEVAPPCGNSPGGSRHYPVQPGQQDGRHVVQPQTDPQGNPDLGKWPFTNNNRGRNPRQTLREGGAGANNRNQRLFYRSADRATHFNPQDFNPAVYGINANEIPHGRISDSYDGEK
ncbi:proprotein convertase subtilisin/kexin type 5 [Biomphalaria pfeifferi]|uniref:Proprotein convertase subtilisin/kexin type 5 n=1 Tax=Biomphalaria pfeifferi TaxID=112525 RepID=A0AAD8BI20_BIOPF|nr:proprotein convertase subtilisin/kexin type 5 [Biomphalaria pfeifferi]